MHLDHVGREIYQPGFSNARAGVQRKLDVAVGSSRSVRDLDHQENISGSRMRRPIAVGPRPEQRHIGLGFPPCPQDQRILHPHDSRVSYPPRQQRGQSVDATRVFRTDRRHLDDLPVEQFDSVVLVQNAQLCQAVVVVHRERALEQSFRHT